MQKKLWLRSWKVQKRHVTVIGVAFRGKIESEEVAEKLRLANRSEFSEGMSMVR